MAIGLSGVKSPNGDVSGSVWFPALSSGEVDTLLGGFITDAYTHTADDDAAELWVYYRAATQVADRMTVNPAQWTGDLTGQGGGGETTLQNQIQYWIDKAAGYLAAFNEIITDVDGDDSLSGWNVIRSLRHA